jgi:hypothetical protein
MQQANQGEAELEHVEWEAVAALREGARSYLAQRVVPDLERALRSG